MKRLRPTDENRFLEETLGHADLVYALARRLVPRGEDAADLVQETYLRAYAAWGRRRPDDVAAWLATICLNAGRDDLRRRGRRPTVLLGTNTPEQRAETDTAEEAIGRATAATVHAALQSLPDAQRVAITLMDLCGFAAAEVARITGSPRGTVLARVHRGRKLLASLLDAQTFSTDETADDPRS